MSTLLKLDGKVISTSGKEEDSMGWLEAGNKSFTIRSAYALLSERSSDEVWKGWKNIWGLKTQRVH